MGGYGRGISKTKGTREGGVRLIARGSGKLSSTWSRVNAQMMTSLPSPSKEMGVMSSSVHSPGTALRRACRFPGQL